MYAIRSYYERDRIEYEAVDLVFEVLVENRQPDSQRLVAKLPVDSHFVRGRFLRLQIRIADELCGEKTESFDERRVLPADTDIATHRITSYNVCYTKLLR